MDPPTAKLPESLRDPSTLFFQYASVRRLIIAAYWVVIILATPIWWYTTSIQRLPLPISQASQEIHKNMQLPARVYFKDIPRPNRGGLPFQVVDDKSSYNDVYTVQYGPIPSINHRTIEYPARGSESAEGLLTTLFSPQHSDNRAVQFASRYRLSFSLLNEDAASGNVVMGWNIEAALRRYITPILNRVSHLHNFTIESQVQFHAPLAFDVRQLDSNTHGLSYEDLTVFVNSAEWTLSSSFSNDPVIHLVMFVPSANHSPLRILETDDASSTSNAFILPQWGGIVLYNPSEQDLGNPLSKQGQNQVFSAFANQLLSLLGVPHLPPSIKRDPKDRDQIIDWQLDTLLRRRTLETFSRTQETLQSFIKLVNRIENMPIGQSVSDDVHVALDALAKVDDSSDSSLSDIFTYSAKAFNHASQAFFNPGMLALLYFPAEHKYAVYTPLFASALAPVVITALRELKAWNRERKLARIP